jgi:hypothetical protein
MAHAEEFIWYASYGSNILEQRFLCYIQGGRPVGSTKTYSGSSDKTPPLRKEQIIINMELYFAGSSSVWDNGGIAYIAPSLNSSFKTLGRMYLISKQQFLDLLNQEAFNLKSIPINFNKAISDKSLIFDSNSLYNTIIFLGMKDGFPIFTLTAKGKVHEANKPSESYLKIIIKGLKETYQLNDEEIRDYFISKSGIDSNYNKEELARIIKKVND